MALRSMIQDTGMADDGDRRTVAAGGGEVVPLRRPPATPAPRAETPQLSTLERQVIALARNDTMASLEPPGWFGRTLASLFGLRRRGRALADPRLEALRRAAVVTHARHHLPDPLAAELRQAGFSPAQIRLVEALATG